MEKISVIMPAYNAGNTIEATIKSVLKQSYTNFELIIINDGSKDNTEEVCKKYFKNKKIKYMVVPNQGVSKCRNLGISLATGKKVCFIDSDDFYVEDYLSSLIKYSTFDLVSCGYTNYIPGVFNSDVSIKSFNTKNFYNYYEKLHSNYLFNTVWNKMFDLSIIKKHDISFDSSLCLAEDYKFVFDYCKHCNNFKYLNKCLYLYRITNSGLGFSFNKDAGKIKIDITDSIYNYYKDNNVNTLYLEKTYVKNLFSLLVNALYSDDSKNKYSIIKKVVNSDVYISSLDKVKSNLGFKNNLLKNILKTKNCFIILLFTYIAFIYDKRKKKTLYGLGK